MTIMVPASFHTSNLGKRHLSSLNCCGKASNQCEVGIEYEILLNDKRSPMHMSAHIETR